MTKDPLAPPTSDKCPTHTVDMDFGRPPLKDTQRDTVEGPAYPNYYENGDYHRLKDKYHAALSREINLLVKLEKLERKLDDIKDTFSSTRPSRAPGS